MRRYKQCTYNKCIICTYYPYAICSSQCRAPICRRFCVFLRIFSKCNKLLADFDPFKSFEVSIDARQRRRCGMVRVGVGVWGAVCGVRHGAIYVNVSRRCGRRRRRRRQIKPTEAEQRHRQTQPQQQMHTEKIPTKFQIFSIK